MATKQAQDWYEVFESKHGTLVRINRATPGADSNAMGVNARHAGRSIAAQAKRAGAEIVHLSVAPGVHNLDGLAAILRVLSTGGIETRVLMGNGRAVPAAIRHLMAGEASERQHPEYR